MKRNSDKSNNDRYYNEPKEPFSAWSDDDAIDAFPLREAAAHKQEQDGRYYQDETQATPVPRRIQEPANGRRQAVDARLKRQQMQEQDQVIRSHTRSAVRQAQVKPKRKKRWTVVFFTIAMTLAAVLIGAGLVWNYLTGKFMTDPDPTRIPPTVLVTDEVGSEHIVTPTPIPQTSIYAEGIQNFLLLGSDSRDDGEHDLADVIMILSIDNNSQQMKLSSVQRDMLVYLGGDSDELMKINAVLAHGPQLLVHTINKNLSLDLQGYVEINMSGTETVIDMMDGIDVDVPDDEGFLYHLNLAIFEQNVLDEGWDNRENYVADVEDGGLQRLNGRQALAYMRVRKTDSDYRRTERQREVMELLLAKFLKQNPLKMAQIVREGLSFVTTDLSGKDIFTMATSVIPAMKGGLSQMQIPATHTFWEDERGNIVPSFNLLNPQIHDFIYGNRDHQLAVPQIPQAPALETDYYIEPGTKRFVEAYTAEFGEEGAATHSWAEYNRQIAAGYVHRDPPGSVQEPVQDSITEGSSSESNGG